MTEIADEFRGDDASLVRSIEALIGLNDDGALVPHGIGGHARALLSAAAVRLSAASKPIAWLAPTVGNNLSVVSAGIAEHMVTAFPVYGRQPISHESETGNSVSEQDARDAARWRQFLSMIDPDKVPGGFTVYFAVEKGTDQLCFPNDAVELVDAGLDLVAASESTQP